MIFTLRTQTVPELDWSPRLIVPAVAPAGMKAVAEAVCQPKLPVGAPAPRQTSSCGVLKWSMSLTPFHCSGGTLTFSPFTS